MGWNHRLIAHEDGDETYFQIHEVYYNKKGKPNGLTKEGISIGSDSIKGIKWTLKMMKKCLKKPILSYKDFPKTYKK